MNYVTCNLMGGLGNNLFQISSAYAMSLKYDKKFVIDSKKIITKTKNNYLGNYFNKITLETKNIKYNILNEKSFSYSELPNIEGNIELYGYFQSEKYFKNYRYELLSLFDLDPSFTNTLLSKYKDLFSTKTCSIHVRRGDYLKLQDYHTLLPIDYFNDAYHKMGSDKTYLIFSDDIEWCKNNFDFINKKIFVTGNSDYEDLFLMSRCDNNIISNSTFSWWGGWLNKNENKVIAPINWFGPKNKSLETKDLYCEGWEVI